MPIGTTTPGPSETKSNDKAQILHIPQNRNTNTSCSLMLYPG